MLPRHSTCLAPTHVRCGLWLLPPGLVSFGGCSQGLTVGEERLRSKEHSLCFSRGVSGLVGKKRQRHAWPGWRGLAGTPRPVPLFSQGLPVSQVPSSPLKPKAFALGGHQRDAICLMFLLGETDGGQEALFFSTLT